MARCASRTNWDRVRDTKSSSLPPVASGVIGSAISWKLTGSSLPRPRFDSLAAAAVSRICAVRSSRRLSSRAPSPPHVRHSDLHRHLQCSRRSPIPPGGGVTRSSLKVNRRTISRRASMPSCGRTRTTHFAATWANWVRYAAFESPAPRTKHSARRAFPPAGDSVRLSRARYHLVRIGEGIFLVGRSGVLRTRFMGAVRPLTIAAPRSAGSSCLPRARACGSPRRRPTGSRIRRRRGRPGRSGRGAGLRARCARGGLRRIR